MPLFRTIPTVTAAYRAGDVPERAAGYAAGTMTLGWEERLRARARRCSDDGAEFATALPRGTVLRAGDVLVVDDLALAVSVVERPEAVFVVRPRSPGEWGLYGYQIGNSHQPMMIDGGEIICADLPGMAQVLAQHGIPFERATRPFTPLSGAAAHHHEA
jgi:urease accessory protein